MTAALLKYKRPPAMKLADALAYAPMSNADILELNAFRVCAKTGSAFEVLPPRRRVNWGALGLIVLAGVCSLMLIGRGW